MDLKYKKKNAFKEEAQIKRALTFPLKYLVKENFVYINAKTQK